MKQQYVFWRHDNKPTVFVMVGISGSGKSHLAQQILTEDAKGYVNAPVLYTGE